MIDFFLLKAKCLENYRKRLWAFFLLVLPDMALEEEEGALYLAPSRCK
jgi:hypothetical protein